MNTMKKDDSILEKITTLGRSKKKKEEEEAQMITTEGRHAIDSSGTLPFLTEAILAHNNSCKQNRFLEDRKYSRQQILP